MHLNIHIKLILECQLFILKKIKSRISVSGPSCGSAISIISLISTILTYKTSTDI
jgi:hypothetical protein